MADNNDLLGGVEGDMKRAAQDMESKSKSDLSGEEQKFRDKVNQLAAQHGLDPNKVEQWPQKVKDQLKQDK